MKPIAGVLFLFRKCFCCQRLRLLCLCLGFLLLSLLRSLHTVAFIFSFLNTFVQLKLNGIDQASEGGFRSLS